MWRRRKKDWILSHSWYIRCVFVENFHTIPMLVRSWQLSRTFFSCFYTGKVVGIQRCIPALSDRCIRYSVNLGKLPLAVRTFHTSFECVTKSIQFLCLVFQILHLQYILKIQKNSSRDKIFLRIFKHHDYSRRTVI